MAHDAAVVVVPAHLRELAGDGVVPQHRVPRRGRRAIQARSLAGGVRRDGHAGEEHIRLRVELLHYGGDVEAVDKEGSTARAVSVRQKVEQLEAARIGLRTRLNECALQKTI